jgi:uncharacterized protein
MKKLDMVILSLLIAGGINWGLWGFFKFNLLEYIIGNIWIISILYIIFGAAAIYYMVRWGFFFGRSRNK